MNSDLKYSLILLTLSALGFYMWINKVYMNIPAAFGWEVREHNFFVGIIGGLIAIIVWLILIIIVFGISLAGFFGIFITPILVIISLFSKDRMFGNFSSNKNTYNYGRNYNNGYSSNGNYSQDTLERIEKEAISKGVLAPGKRGQYIDKRTGKFKEEFFFNLLNRDTDDSIDLKTGKYQTTNFFGTKTDTGKKIDLKTGEISKEAFFGNYEKTDTRINQDSGRIEKKGFFGDWQKTDERVNPDTGKKQEKDFLGIFWKDKDE